MVGLAQIFSTLDLMSSYHQLPLWLQDRVKMAFRRVDYDWKDQLYHGKFIAFSMKNALTKFQHVMDQVLGGLALHVATSIMLLSLVTC